MKNKTWNNWTLAIIGVCTAVIIIGGAYAYFIRDGGTTTDESSPGDAIVSDETPDKTEHKVMKPVIRDGDDKAKLTDDKTPDSSEKSSETSDKREGTDDKKEEQGDEPDVSSGGD